MDYAGLIFDESFHYLDHLGPFCVLANCPLIVCEDRIARFARRYYPKLEVIETDFLRPSLPRRIISCDPLPLLKDAFPQMEYLEIYWLPHGNSDKGWKAPYFESLQSETAAFVYGKKMIDFMARKNAKPHTISIGNFRYRYFLQNQDAYRRIVREEISDNLPKNNRNYLYAPTWEDAEGNGSFWTAFPSLAKSLPPDCNLIVKIHPNTHHKFAPELEILQGRHAHQNNLFFLPEFPPIYPLLDICSAYIGDMSSIGYDFLTFDKPLFFLNPAPSKPPPKTSHYLYRCGIEIPISNLSSLFQCKEPEELAAIRKEAYRYTFDPPPNDLTSLFKA